LTLSRSFDVISFANRSLFRIGRVAALTLINMKSRDKFSFAGAGSIYRVSASFHQGKSPQIS